MKVWKIIFLFVLAAGCAKTEVEESRIKFVQPLQEKILPPPRTEIPRSEETIASETAPLILNIVRAALDDYGAAPELENEIWLSTDQALRLASLRGKVVLIDMWTFG